MKISVIGTGYVGLVTGVCFAEMGNDVICMDVDNSKIEMLNNGESPIYEPGLDEMIRRNAFEGRLVFTSDMKEAVSKSLLIFIAVGTPMGNDGSCDLSQVKSVSRMIGEMIDSYKIIVDKSTVPVGTADKVKAEISEVLRQRGVEIEFDVVSNPEFLKEGAAIDDFMRPDRIVVGTDSPKCAEILRELYAPYVRTNRPILEMNVRSAEMTKYAANALLACRISLMNELANLSERMGADIDMVRLGVGFDDRIGQKFLFPGVGFGGSCFPKDVRALIHMGRENDYRTDVLEAVDLVNNKQKKVLVQKIVSHFGEDLTGKVIAVWGLAFKPHTDDVREAPSLVIVSELLERGARIRAYDPKAMKAFESHFKGNPQITYHRNNYEAAEGADAIALITEWGVFREPDFDRLKAIMRGPVIFDGRNQYTPSRLRKREFVYYSIGRK